MSIRLFALLASLGLCACGPIIGDPCTVNTECGAGVCLNRDFAPGGLCSRRCSATDVCPAGSVCLDGVVAGDTAGCLRTCAKDADCRTGYTCRTEGGSQVCLGPGGL